MKKFLIILFGLLCISCAPSYMTVANVTLLDRHGETLRYYPDVILDEVPTQDTLSTISFKEYNGTKHVIEEGTIVVEGVEKVQRTTSSRDVYVVYRRGYPEYLNYRYRYVPAPRPVPVTPTPRPNTPRTNRPRR